MKYAVNDEGVNALNATASSLVETLNSIYQNISGLQSFSEGYEDTLGPHKASLNEALKEIYVGLKNSAEPVQSISATLKEVAEAYQEIIDNDNLKGNGIDVTSVGALAGNQTTGGSGVISNSIPTVKETGRGWSEGLSSNEYNAVKDYTGNSFYENINGVLRGTQSNFDPGNRERAIHLHSALSKSQIPCDCTVYRGAPLKCLGEYQNLSNEELVGHTITEPGFMSTSINKGDEFGGEVKLEIDVPKGSNGAYVGFLSQAGHYESEVLFDAGQVMEITGARNDPFGNRIISVRIIK